jgi:hypothetical protein
MVVHYYYAHGAVEHGPYSALQMRAMADAGQIEPDDSVWQEGRQQRTLASRINNLYSPPGSPPAPAAAAPPAVEAAAVETKLDVPAVSAAATPPAAPAVAKKVEPARVKRVVSIRGGILCTQDGTTVRFKKKCDKCGHEDQTRSTAAIRVGSIRVPFFCPKCRKSRTVDMSAIG